MRITYNATVLTIHCIDEYEFNEFRFSLITFFTQDSHHETFQANVSLLPQAYSSGTSSLALHPRHLPYNPSPGTTSPVLLQDPSFHLPSLHTICPHPKYITWTKLNWAWCTSNKQRPRTNCVLPMDTDSISSQKLPEFQSLTMIDDNIFNFFFFDSL